MKIKKEYTIAIVAISGIALLIFGVNFLKGLDLLEKRNVYHVVYRDISGITSASPVFYNGLKVGQVIGTTMVPDGTGNIAISFQLNEEDLHLKSDSRAEIYSVDLFSRAIRVVQGTSAGLAQAGDTLQGGSELSLTDAVGRQIDPLKAKAESMLANVDSVLNSLQQLMNKEAVGDIDSSFSSIRDALQTLAGTARRLDELVAMESATLSATLRNMQQVSGTLAENSDELDRTFNNLDTLSAELAHGRLKKVLDELATTSAELRKITTGINSGEGSMGKLVKNDSLYVNLNNASRELDLLLEDLRLNPNRYFSVFGKKDRLPKLSDSDVQRIKDAVKQDQRTP
ncbi:MAG: MCE family protein [Flavobacteriales bacterium]|nr:MCE family protein [Flavobacteriales bacterium]